MSSPTTTIYASTDASAPVLTGAVGSLVALLNACLVAGYGAKSGAGWTRPYNASNDSVFLSGGTNPKYLNVLDNAESAGGAKEARASGFETMSAISTGTGQFPTTTQSATGICIRKSSTADGTARPWILVATNSTFYLFIQNGDYTAPMCHGFMFGDFNSYKAGGDAYGTIIIGKQIENDATSTNERLAYANVGINGGAITGHYVDRNYTGIGSSIAAQKYVDGSKTALTSSTMGSAGAYILYPNAPDGGLMVCPVYIAQTVGGNYVQRGYLYGLWNPLHAQPLNHLDTISCSGAMAGKTLMAINVANSGQVLIETSSTWT